MNKLVITQGDQLSFGFPIYFKNALIREDDVDDVEISIGTFVIKSYKNGGVIFNDLTNTFELLLTQKDTFRLLPSHGNKCGYFEYPSQVRVKLKESDGTQNYIFNVPGPNVEVLESLSKERL